MAKSQREMVEKSDLDKENVDPKKRCWSLSLKKKKANHFSTISKQRQQPKAMALYTMAKNWLQAASGL